MSEKPKYGSKSSEDPNRRHFFKWSGERSGEGTGKCLYCELKMKFKGDGPRGGKVRVYSKDGKTWSEKELQCHVREHAVAAKEPAKKSAKNGNGTKKSAKKNGTSKRSAGGAKKGAKKLTARKSPTKKRSTKKSAPAAEAPASTTEAQG